MGINYDDIYRVCLIVHKLTKLYIEFLPEDNIVGTISPFILSIRQAPYALKPYRERSINFINEHLKQNKEGVNSFYHYTDSLMLSYLAIPLEKQNFYLGMIIVGPFLNDIPNDNLISSIIYHHGFPIQLKDTIHQYYKGLSILDASSCKNIGHITINLLLNPFTDCNMKNFQPQGTYDVVDEHQKEKMWIDFNKVANEIEMRYRYEKVLLKAIEEGNKEKALQLRTFIQFDPSHRTPNNPLRAHKNIAFSVNTMFRLAAERGGVPPIYLHNLSDKFAILIEKISNFTELENIITRMICEYCELVQKKAAVGHSPVVKKVIEYITFNFNKAISLKSIAENIGVNPSHLSRQFKKEIGIGITEFINKRRIQEAQFLMTQGISSITDIAISVGFESYNYFCRVFKKITSMTPKEYLKQQGKAIYTIS